VLTEPINSWMAGNPEAIPKLGSWEVTVRFVWTLMETIAVFRLAEQRAGKVEDLRPRRSSIGRF